MSKNRLQGCIHRDITSRIKVVIFPLRACQASSGVLCSVLVFTIEENADRLENVQRRVTKMIKELENLTYEETLKDLDLISMEKAHEGRHRSIPELKGQLQREGSLFTRSHAEKTKARSTNCTGRGFL